MPLWVRDLNRNLQKLEKAIWKVRNSLYLQQNKSFFLEPQSQILPIIFCSDHLKFFLTNDKQEQTWF